MLLISLRSPILVSILILFMIVVILINVNKTEKYYLGEYWKVKQCKCPRNIDIV